MKNIYKILVSVIFVFLLACPAFADVYLAKKDNVLLKTVNYFFPDDLYDQILKEKYNYAIAGGCKRVVVKAPSTAAVLGFLPGGGSFYTREKVLGVADLLLWPFGSSLWDAPLAWKRAKVMNMEETLSSCQGIEKL